MIEKKEVYYCEECHNLVESLWNGSPNLKCCAKPMVKLEANTTDAAVEKHVPVIEKIDGGYIVKVGSVAHPMGNDHYIEWIELASDDGMFVQRQMLTPTSSPEAQFKTDAAKVVARAYCNLHGLWKD